MSEDGFIPDHYPVEELEGSDTSDTIRRNVKDSDGTAIIFFGEIEDEPEEALDCCVQLGKPYRLVDALELQPGQAAKTIADFIKDKGLISLNIVGTKLSLSEKLKGSVLRLLVRFSATRKSRIQSDIQIIRGRRIRKVRVMCQIQMLLVQTPLLT
jgi:hypothetical protein